MNHRNCTNPHHNHQTSHNNNTSHHHNQNYYNHTNNIHYQTYQHPTTYQHNNPNLYSQHYPLNNQFSYRTSQHQNNNH